MRSDLACEGVGCNNWKSSHRNLKPYRNAMQNVVRNMVVISLAVIVLCGQSIASIPGKCSCDSESTKTSCCSSESSDANDCCCDGKCGEEHTGCGCGCNSDSESEQAPVEDNRSADSLVLDVGAFSAGRVLPETSSNATYTEHGSIRHVAVSPQILFCVWQT